MLGQDQEDDSDAESTPAQIVECELSDYISERGCRIDNCPYQWWKEGEARFPCMSQLAKRYLNVQAMSASSERLFSAFGLVYEHAAPHVSDERNGIGYNFSTRKWTIEYRLVSIEQGFSTWGTRTSLPNLHHFVGKGRSGLHVVSRTNR